jgi:hypothetical protein
MAKKRISFVSNGRRVTFYAKSLSKIRAPTSRRPYRTSSRISNKTRRDAERFVEAGLGWAHPAAPVVIAGARLMRDILK